MRTGWAAGVVVTLLAMWPQAAVLKLVNARVTAIDGASTDTIELAPGQHILSFVNGRAGSVDAAIEVETGSR